MNQTHFLMQLGLELEIISLLNDVISYHFFWCTKLGWGMILFLGEWGWSWGMVNEYHCFFRGVSTCLIISHNFVDIEGWDGWDGR